MFYVIYLKDFFQYPQSIKISRGKIVLMNLELNRIQEKVARERSHSSRYTFTGASTVTPIVILTVTQTVIVIKTPTVNLIKTSTVTLTKTPTQILIVMSLNLTPSLY
jgi:hypothetical protein